MKRTFSSVAAASALAVSLAAVAACSSNSSPGTGSSGQATHVIKYGVTGTTAGDVGIYVGQKMGIFAKYHLDVQTVTVSSGSATDLVNLVASGDVDIADALPDPVVAAAAHSTGFRVLTQDHPTPERLAARKGLPAFADVAALAEVKVGVSSPTTSIAALSRFMLEKNGIPAAKVKFVVLGGTSARYAALKNGAIDVALLGQPSDFQAAADGMTILADSTTAEYAPWYGSTDISTVTIIKNKCDDLKQFYAARREIHTYLADPANAPKIVDVLVSVLKTTPTLASQSLELYRQDNALTAVIDPTADLTGTAQLNADLGTKVTTDPASLVDTSCVGSPSS